MDSYNKNTTRRKAQSIQDMINSTPATGSGLKKSGYSGPKNATGRVTGNTQSLYATSDLSGINRLIMTDGVIPMKECQSLKSRGIRLTLLTLCAVISLREI